MTTGTWQYLGVIGLFDPPREDSAATITEAKKLGVNVKMVTGDHIAIAKEISGQVGLGKNILPQTAFVAGDGEETRHQLEAADGFAQVLPGEQVPDRENPAGRRPHRRDDRGRRERCPGTPGGRCRYCCRRGDRCRKVCCGYRPDKTRALGHHRCDRAEPGNIPADGKLRGVPDRRDGQGPDLPDPLYCAPGFLPGNRTHARRARDPERSPDHDDRV